MQPPQFQSVEKIGQQRPPDTEPLLERLRKQAEQSRQEKRKRTGSPGLRMAGNRIVDRDFIRLPIEAAKEFRKLMRMEMVGGIDQPMENPQRLPISSIAPEPRGNDRIIVRPHRAEVIADGIIGAFLGREGANTPSAEHIFSHEPL